MQNRKIIMHIDMNSYFASVEQQANLFLRGRPVGVCAYLSPGGCIIASSMEAKAKGVKTGCRVRDAKVLCPEIFLIENEPAKYRSTTEKIFAIFEEYTDRVEHYSIDEAFLDLTGWANERIIAIRHPEVFCSVIPAKAGIQEEDAQRHFSALSWIPHHPSLPIRSVRDDSREEGQDVFYWAKVTALIIRERIKIEVGEWMDCSIGISYTKFLAKFASDIADKKSVLVIRQSSRNAQRKTLHVTCNA